jgi:phenylacetate-CoA ligase
MELYWRLPVRVQELALSRYARRLDRLYYGGVFEREYATIRSHRWANPAEIAAWQLDRLNGILEAARRHVPYYRDSAGSPDHPLSSLEELASHPALDRQRIRQREAEFLDDRLDRSSLFQDKTSGSTGTAMTVYWPAPALQRLWAVFEVRIREAASVSRSVPRAMLGGRPIVRGDQRNPPFWRLNRTWRQLYLSSYHVSEKNAPGYIRAIQDSGVRWLTGYGSAIAALAESAMAAGIPPLPLQVVVVSGDTLQPGMRRSIEKFFQCRCYDSYGQVEGVAMAMECGKGRLHLVPEVGIVEIVGENGQACAAGQVGEIVATGLLNDGMPLLRYRTGDVAAYSVDQQCGCGSSHAIIEALEGRVDDYLVTADGRRIGRLSTALKRSPSIHSAQIVQDRPGHAYLLVRPSDGYRSADAIPVRDDIVERIGGFDFEIVEVDEVPKTPTGKTRLVVRLENRPELEILYSAVVEKARRVAKPVSGGARAADGGRGRR